MGRATFIKDKKVLYSGTSIELSEEDLAKARAEVDADLMHLREDFIQQVERLDHFIKLNIGAIPRASDFADDFFDSLSIRYTGTNLPKITDDQILEYAQQYVDTLKRKLEKPKTKTPKESLTSFKWLKSEESLEYLRNQLTGKYVAPETTKEAFQEVFAGGKLKDIRSGIIWHFLSKNGLTNKRSIYDLLTALSDNSLISEIRSCQKVEINKRLEVCFRDPAGKMKFSNNNSVKRSEAYENLEAIIQSIR